MKNQSRGLTSASSRRRGPHKKKQQVGCARLREDARSEDKAERRARLRGLTHSTRLTGLITLLKQALTRGALFLGAAQPGRPDSRPAGNEGQGVFRRRYGSAGGREVGWRPETRIPPRPEKRQTVGFRNQMTDSR